MTKQRLGTKAPRRPTTITISAAMLSLLIGTQMPSGWRFFHTTEENVLPTAEQVADFFEAADADETGQLKASLNAEFNERFGQGEPPIPVSMAPMTPADPCPVHAHDGVPAAVGGEDHWQCPTDYRVRWRSTPLEETRLASSDSRTFVVPGPGARFVTFRHRLWWADHAADWTGLLDEHDLYDPGL